MLKKTFSILVAVLVAVSMTIPSQAATEVTKLNKKYWVLQAEYDKAKESGASKDIIAAAQKTYDLFVGTGDTAAIAQEYTKNGDLELNILSTYMLEAAKAAESLGDYAEAVRLYRIFLPFGKGYMSRLGAAEQKDYTEFLLKPVEAKIKAYSVTPIFFTETAATEPVAYTGAKFEPKNGIYYGTVNPYPNAVNNGNKLIASNPKAPSGTLVYVSFEKELISDYDYAFKDLLEKTDIIEIAWNLDETPNALDNALKQTKKIEEAANYLSSLKEPILLRVGAEMNVWSPPANPHKFKEFFILVAKTMKQKAPNVAMLFSPNDISAIEVQIMDYYPGDEYVDWVGVSNYYSPYFLGKKDNPSETDATYFTGEYARPILKLENIVSLFGGKKPIALSEYGVANYSNTNKEPFTQWAAHRLKQLQYYVPMMYPQIKAMFYFDVDRSKHNENDNFALDNQPEINQLYNKLMDSSIYLAKGKQAAEKAYAKVGSGTVSAPANKVTLYTYLEVINQYNLTVTYSIGGNAFTVSDMPYCVNLDLSTLADGKHSIDVSVKAGAVEYSSSTINVLKNGNNVLLSTGVTQQ